MFIKFCLGLLKFEGVEDPMLDYYEAIYGPKGSAKSNLSAWTAFQVQPDLTIDQVFFDINLLIEFLEDENTLGRLAILDEAGIGLNKQHWMERSPQMFKALAMTGRLDRRCILFNLTSLNWLETSQVEMLSGAVWKHDPLKKTEAEYEFPKQLRGLDGTFLWPQGAPDWYVRNWQDPLENPYKTYLPFRNNYPCGDKRVPDDHPFLQQYYVKRAEARRVLALAAVELNAQAPTNRFTQMYSGSEGSMRGAPKADEIEETIQIYSAKKDKKPPRPSKSNGLGAFAKKK